MEERLQKIIASCGVASRRHAEQLILDGRVTCNGSVCQLGDRADPNVYEILLDGKPLPKKEEFQYIMLNKPRGYVTTLSDEKGRKNVSELVKDCNCRVYPVGRLDMDSDGLLLMTNDGDFAYRLMHPKHEINKTYRVHVKGFTEGGLDRFSKPMQLDGYQLQIPSVSVVHWDMGSDRAVLDITIHEGRNRQVRRMCALAGMDVLKLTRIQEGKLSLGSLKIGQWRHLHDCEVEELKKF